MTNIHVPRIRRVSMGEDNIMSEPFPSIAPRAGSIPMPGLKPMLQGGGNSLTNEPPHSLSARRRSSAAAAAFVHAGEQAVPLHYNNNNVTEENEDTDRHRSAVAGMNARRRSSAAAGSMLTPRTVSAHHSAPQQQQQQQVAPILYRGEAIEDQIRCSTGNSLVNTPRQCCTTNSAAAAGTTINNKSDIRCGCDPVGVSTPYMREYFSGKAHQKKTTTSVAHPSLTASGT